jgi:predicted glycosyltransferase
VVAALARQAHACVVVLARHPEQRRALAEVGAGRYVVPAVAVDSRSLMYEADLVIGAGGTMTREAALLGIPTLTIYAGRPPFVDQCLEQRGLLRRLRDVNELDVIMPRRGEPFPLDRVRARAAELVDVFASVTADAADRRPGGRSAPSG